MRMFQTLISTAAIASGLVLSPLAFAQSKDAAYEAMAVNVHDGEFATIQQFETPAGISVWLVEEPSIPILSVRMAWEKGSTSDPIGQEGLTKALVYHMNEGAGDLDSQAFSKTMEELNMSFGCSSATDNTYCNASMLTFNAGEAMELVALALADPRFDEGPFGRFVREEEVGLKTRETNPRYLASEAVEAALYPDHAYARDFTADSLAALTREAAKAHKDEIMTQDGMIVTAVGAMDAKSLAKLIDQAASGLAVSAKPFEVEPVTLNDAVPEPIVVPLPQPQSLVQFTGPGLTQDDPDFYPATVLNYTFGGGGFESRLMKELRVARGLTYGIYTRVSAGEKMQTWSGGGQTKNESVGDFIAGIEAEMIKIVDEGITAEELSDAKAYLTGSYPLGFDSNSKIAGRMMNLRLDDLPVDFFDKRNALIEAVTLEDVNRVAKEYLKPENFTYVIVGEPVMDVTEAE